MYNRIFTLYITESFKSAVKFWVFISRYIIYSLIPRPCYAQMGLGMRLSRGKVGSLPVIVSQSTIIKMSQALAQLLSILFQAAPHICELLNYLDWNKSALLSGQLAGNVFAVAPKQPPSCASHSGFVTCSSNIPLPLILYSLPPFIYPVFLQARIPSLNNKVLAVASKQGYKIFLCT